MRTSAQQPRVEGGFRKAILPNGIRLVTERIPHVRSVAVGVWVETGSRHEAAERAGLEGIVDLRLGRALDTLPALAREGAGPFDLIFIDADKPSIPDYFTWSLKLSRRGSLIIVDNVVREGAVIEADSTDESVRGVRRFLEMMSAEPRVSATAIQTVGTKGYDGFSIALVTADPE